LNNEWANLFQYHIRKKKAIHKTTTTDDKRLQSTLKRIGVNAIPAIEEVNIFKEDVVIQFINPKGNISHCLLPQDVVVRRQDKGSNHSSAEPEPVNDHEVQLTPRPSEVEGKLVNANSQRESKECCSESSVKVVLSSSMLKEVGYDVSVSEDEDVCPTCLEEYTLENPKIITQYFHHYHLSYIYEWMERSENCPVCGKNHR
ncbi:hypothetical protein ACH5RR_013256, partial [Cinchona calisaya]